MLICLVIHKANNNPFYSSNNQDYRKKTKKLHERTYDMQLFSDPRSVFTQWNKLS